MGYKVILEERGAQTLYGLSLDSRRQTQAQDITALAQRYRVLTGTEEGQILPFYVLSRGYEPETESFRIFAGGELTHPGLEELTLPAGTYAVIRRRLLHRLLWGGAVGAAKRYVYQRWLPGTDWQPGDLEYERHTQASLDSRPLLELYCYIKKAEEA